MAHFGYNLDNTQQDKSDLTTVQYFRVHFTGRK